MGVTSVLPKEVPFHLLDYGAQPHEWNYVGSTIFHNGKELCHGLPDLDDLEPNQRVGFLLSRNGDIHVYLDGHHVRKVASNLPVHKHLWGAIDVRGKCIKVKSELLSGELYGLVGVVVCVCVYNMCVFFSSVCLKCFLTAMSPLWL